MSSTAYIGGRTGSRNELCLRAQLVEHRGVKLGLRVQILLLLGGLLLATLVPLHFTIATYIEVAVEQQWEANLAAQGEAAASRIRADLSGDRTVLGLRLRGELASPGIVAIGVYSSRGNTIAELGDATLLPSIVSRVLATSSTSSQTIDVQLPGGKRGLAMASRDRQQTIVTVFEVNRDRSRIRPLLRLLALSTGLIGLTLLGLSYFALTRLIVRPLDALSQAAQRVATGARQLDLPRGSAPELTELGDSLQRMTVKLLTEEAALRRKIDEVEEATLNLRQAQDHLVRSERLASVGRLAAGLAHEVGNPIAALIGLQDLLLAGGLSSEEVKDFLRRMRAETERIHRILRDLLQFARPGSATSAPDVGVQPGDVNRAVLDTLALVSPQQTFENIAFISELPTGLPKVVLSREQLVQVLLNLFLNAADACAGRSQASITVNARLDAAQVIISVSDTGPGVAASVADKLFEPFVTTKDIGHGTGLGLAVCRGLVEAVGGSIGVDASYTNGARFVLRLPHAETEQAS